MKEYFKTVLFTIILLLFMSINVLAMFLLGFIINFLPFSFSDMLLNMVIAIILYSIFILPLTFTIYEKILDKY